ncbi:MAG: hypothetical protein PHZ25_03430 [Candidatus Pacebacteria bacterium]|nr:hypothetical protein [Candidatus Paceibacterota bacterium]
MTITYIKPKLKLLQFVLVLSVISIAFLTLPNRFREGQILADDISLTPDEITVSATIGTTAEMVVYGYAPASSTVSLTGNGISEERKAETNGYFYISKIYTSSGTSTYPELCLVAHIGSLSTQPTCLPSLPGGNYVYQVGPVILSPIISIEQNIFPIRTQVALNGVTIPNAKVSIYLAEAGRSISLVPKALAYYLPTYEVTSNSLGKFQFNLPSNNTAKWKVYASTAYLSSISPKSTTLNFRVESNIHYLITRIYETIVKTTNSITTVITTNDRKGTAVNESQIVNLSTSETAVLRSRLLYFVIFVEVLILAILIFVLLKKKNQKPKKTLVESHGNSLR